LGPSISLNEGNAGTTSFAFPVTLSNAPPSDVTVVIATSDGTATVADNDYQPLTQTLTFSPGGALTQNVTVLVNGDTTVESDETFNVTLSNATGGATITTANSTGTILNDDSAVGVPVLSIGNVTLQEGNDGVGTFSFLITLSQASTEQITVAYATANGSASAGEDYTATSGTLTIAPGSTDSTVNVSVSGDLDFEADETFFVNLSSPVNVTFPGGGNTLQATGTITNDDAAPAGAIIESAPVSQTAVGAFSLFEPAAATPASQPAAFSTRFRSGKTKTLVLGAPRDLPAGAAPMQPIVPPVAIESLEPIAVASAKSSLPNAAIEPALADRAFAQYFAQEPTYQPAKPLKKKVLVLGR
jgi:chitinase